MGQREEQTLRRYRAPISKPDHRRALRSVALQFWVNGAVFSSFVPRFPELRGQIGVDLSGLGLLLTLGSLGGLIGSAAGGPLIGRFGSKRTMTAGALGLVCTLPVIGLVQAPTAFLVVVIVMHAFDAVTDMSMNLQGSWLSARRAVPVMSRLHGLWSIGTMIGGAATAVAASLLSLQAHLIVVTIVLLATIAYVAPGLLSQHELQPAQPATGNAAQPGRSGGRRLGFAFALLAVATVGLEIVPSDWSALRLTDDFGLGPGPAGIGFVAFSAGMVTARLGGDFASARLGASRLTRWATSLSLAGLALATLTPMVALSVIGFALAGSGSGVLFPRLYDQAAKAAGRPGMMLGALTAGIRLGIIIIPVSVGRLANTGLSVGAAMALVALPGALLLLLGGERILAADPPVSVST